MEKIKEDVATLIEIFEKNFNDCEVTEILDIKDAYVVHMDRIGATEDTHLLDSFYSVSKSDGSVSGYVPYEDVKRFKQALKSPVYKKGRS